MAKRIIRQRAAIKNAHMIGAGAKFTPVYTNKGKINWRGSVVKQSSKRSVPKLPKTANKAPSKLSVSYKSSVKAKGYNQPQQMPVKAKTVRLKGLQKMKQQIAKSAPSPKVKMKARTPVKKRPPTRSR